MTLIALLTRCRELTELSRDASFSHTGVKEIVKLLDRGIETLQRNKALHCDQRNELKLLFAPTGALQETSIDNGWADEYLSLSSRFDDLIEDA